MCACGRIWENSAVVHYFGTGISPFEIFPSIDHPRKSALDCVESIYNKYAALTETLRTSDYLISLPTLPVSCVELDGEASTMPVIYEDIYKDDETSNIEMTQRRHSFSK